MQAERKAKQKVILFVLLRGAAYFRRKSAMVQAEIFVELFVCVTNSHELCKNVITVFRLR